MAQTRTVLWTQHCSLWQCALKLSTRWCSTFFYDENLSLWPGWCCLRYLIQNNNHISLLPITSEINRTMRVTYLKLICLYILITLQLFTLGHWFPIFTSISSTFYLCWCSCKTRWVLNMLEKYSFFWELLDLYCHC